MTKQMYINPRSFGFRLHCVNSYFHVTCTMPRKTANEIVKSFHKLDFIASNLKFLSCCRASIVTMFAYTNHIVRCWVVVEHCNRKTRKIINLNEESLNDMIEYCRHCWMWKQLMPLLVILKKNYDKKIITIHIYRVHHQP